MIYIGSDHRGFQLKESLKKYLAELGETVEDVGNTALDPEDDYPDFAAAVARKVAEAPEKNRGILLCGSGIGVDIVANKFKGVQSGLCLTPEMAEMGRNDDDINVLALAADFTDQETAKAIVRVFLETLFSGEEKHKRRVEKIAATES